MAPVQGKGSVKKYVEQKNPQPNIALSGDQAIAHSLEAVKVEVPPLGNPLRAAQTRPKHAEPRQAGLSMSPPKIHIPQASASKFYDTDPSNLEDSSTKTGSAFEGNLTENKQDVEDPVLVSSMEESGSDEIEGDEDENSFINHMESPPHPKTELFNGKLSSGLVRKMRGFNQLGTPFHIDGNRLGHLDGDTYPSQTSGPPSKLSCQNGTACYNDAGDDGAQSVPIMGPGNTPIFGGVDNGQTYSPRVDVSQYPPATSQLGMQAVLSAPVADFTKSHSNAVRAIPSNGRVLHPRHSPRHHTQSQLMNLPTRGNQKFEVLSDGTESISLGNAEQLSPISCYKEPDSRFLANSASRPRATIPFTGLQSKVNPNDKDQQQNDHLASAVRGDHPEHDDFSTVRQEFEIQKAQNNDPIHLTGDNDSSDLDYDVPELYSMQYTDIKTQDFDVDPRCQKSQTVESMTSNTLTDKMDALFMSSPDQQSLFFNSLKIDEWEEAGEWFVSRFGNLVKDYKAARQKKRKAARTIEDEIEQRHEEVVRQTQAIGVAMDGIKATGAAILSSGTPQKVKHTMKRRR